MNWHLHSHAKGLIVSGVLILVVIGLPMGFALNRTGDEMKQTVSIMTCNIGEIVGPVRQLRPGFDDVLWPSLDHFPVRADILIPG